MRARGRGSRVLAATVATCALLLTGVARGDPPAAQPAPAPPPDPASRPRSPLEAGQHFTLDPVADGTLTVAGFGFNALLGAVLGTGEIRPPLPTVPASSLLPIDRIAVTQATISAIGATATYLAFVRSPGSVRAWLTLGVSTALTAFVSVERVRAGAHFPTDVLAGSLAGAATGVLVPHLHRHAQEAPGVWVGVSPVPGGGSLDLTGWF